MTQTIRTSWWIEAPLWLLIAAMFALALWSWPGAPERIPVHWNIHGEVDRYGGKVEGLLLLPAMALGLYILFRVLPRFDPGRANYPTFAGAYNVIRFLTLAILAVAYGWIHLALRGRTVVDAQVMGPLVVGFIFIVIGGVMGKLRPNWFVGVRTPWTLSSKRAWVSTHRLAGWLFLLSGLTLWGVLLASPLWAARLIPVLALLSAGATVVHSYLVWRTDPDKVPPAQTLPVDDRR